MSEEEYYNNENNNYHTRAPVHISKDELNDKQLYRLIKSDVFCMIPWIHMHAFPNGNAYPCCLAESTFPLGNLHKKTMKEVWNSNRYKAMRKNMLNEKPCVECSRCYEGESYGFVSMRNDTNKNFGHHIALVDKTNADGALDDFKLRYYDIRFSNLCNMSCRTCGTWFSSSWYKEENDLFGKRDHPQFMYAGKDKEDMWNQMQEHIPYLEQIYFAGGEPLIMEEHYRILDELVRLKKFDVKIIYNTNFSKMSLKDKRVFDYWKLFKNISVGASLDGMGTRAEYIRKGTQWDIIEQNRADMIKECPDVDFYVSATISIMNVLHITDFHRDWVEKGFIKAADWNINILQSPQRMRIDALPPIYKKQIIEKIKAHIKWLEPQDKLTRASGGYEGILNFLDQPADDKLLAEFFEYTNIIDASRNEKFEDTFPEYTDLRSYVTPR